MTKAEFHKAIRLAVSPATVPSYLSEEMVVAVGDCALDNKRRFVTIEQVASLIRGGCQTGEGWDWSELANLQDLSQRFDLVN
jgi:hypothetical protein